PGLAYVWLVYRRYGREPRVAYDRQYEQAPPSELAPALVPALVREQTGVGPAEFTATLFDLIRRGAYTATPVTTEQKSLAGPVADLELRMTHARTGLSPFEETVAEVIDGVVGDAGERLTNFRERIAADKETNAPLFDSFKSEVGEQIATSKWY